MAAAVRVAKNLFQSFDMFCLVSWWIYCLTFKNLRCFFWGGGGGRGGGGGGGGVGGRV